MTMLLAKLALDQWIRLLRAEGWGAVKNLPSRVESLCCYTERQM